MSASLVSTSSGQDSPSTGGVEALWRQWNGPLTEELLRAPGRFGLGQVPRGKQPDAAMRMVCGYCSTGCSLDIHLQQGEAVNLTPTVHYSVNRGMACPKGWEALSVLNSSDRGTAPLVRDKLGRMQAVSWDTAMRTFCDRFKEIQRRHGNHRQARRIAGKGDRYRSSDGC